MYLLVQQTAPRPARTCSLALGCLAGLASLLPMVSCCREKYADLREVIIRSWTTGSLGRLASFRWRPDAEKIRSPAVLGQVSSKSGGHT